MDPRCACDLCERGGVASPPLPPSHRGNRFIIVRHRVIHHGRPLTRVGWHELIGSAKLWRGRTTVLHRNVPKPAESESRRTTQWLGTGWSGCTRPWYTIGVAARTFPSRRSPTSFRTCSTRWRPTSRAFRREAASDTFRGWLRAITRNKVRDHFRKLGREPGGAGGTEAQLLFARLPDDCPDGDESDGGTTDRGLFDRALELIRGEFEDRTWQAFWLTAVEDRPTGEVAAELAMTSGAVRVAKSRVLRRLREEMSELP